MDNWYRLVGIGVDVNPDEARAALQQVKQTQVLSLLQQTQAEKYLLNPHLRACYDQCLSESEAEY